MLLTYFWVRIKLSIVTRHSGLTTGGFVYIVGGRHVVKVVWSRYEILHVARKKKQVGT